MKLPKADAYEIVPYSEVVESLKGTTRTHLLLGNGFSIACDPVFAYTSLYDEVKPNLSPRVHRMFEYLDSSNFEGVMRLLQDGSAACDVYGAPTQAEQMRDDLDGLKKALVTAVAARHLPRMSDIAEDRMLRCYEFLKSYWNVFTVSYDLLLYWVAMKAPLEAFMRRDGFRNSLDNLAGC